MQNPKAAVRCLRISYWAGALWDAMEAVLMLFPKAFAPYIGFEIETGRPFAFGLAYGVPLMAGWTVLLLWADRKPLERKGVLMITVLPVVAGYALLQAAGVSAGVIPWDRAASALAVMTLFAGFLVFSYVYARRKERAA